VKDYKPSEPIGQRLLEVQRIKLEILRLEEELDKQKAYLLGHALRIDQDSLRCGAITVSRRERPSWTYSHAVQDAESALKQRKAREQRNGTATNNPTEHLIVTFSAKVALANANTMEKV
jgi:hypothetical protein